MARRPSTTFEFSIPGDELEQYRIQLEQQIQNTDLSLHLSSSQGDDDSVEYPRHNSNHSLGFASFEQPSQHFDYDGPSGLHAWSTHEDEGVNPYAGETVSTIGHHASAVTIGAGLGGRGQRREISLSGAEYDPDRPLQDMIVGMDSRISILEPHSKSRQTVRSIRLISPTSTNLPSSRALVRPLMHQASTICLRSHTLRHLPQDSVLHLSNLSRQSQKQTAHSTSPAASSPTICSVSVSLRDGHAIYKEVLRRNSLPLAYQISNIFHPILEK
jgi:hypothetical protein